MKKNKKEPENDEIVFNLLTVEVLDFNQWDNKHMIRKEIIF
jgi:hypothetical protein